MFEYFNLKPFYNLIGLFLFEDEDAVLDNGFNYKYAAYKH